MLIGGDFSNILQHYIGLAVAWASLAKSWLPEMLQSIPILVLHYPFGQEFFPNIQYEYHFLTSSATEKSLSALCL